MIWRVCSSSCRHAVVLLACVRFFRAQLLVSLFKRGSPLSYSRDKTGNDQSRAGEDNQRDQVNWFSQAQTENRLSKKIVEA
jgi:hypothetical protein